MDGERVTADEEMPFLPLTIAADGGDLPAGYRLVPGEPGTEWQYVPDDDVTKAMLIDVWGVAGAAAYLRVLSETGEKDRAWQAANNARG